MTFPPSIPKPFRYYIFDTYAGVVQGTDDQALAEQMGDSDQYFVVEPTRNLWILGDKESCHAQVEAFAL